MLLHCSRVPKLELYGIVMCANHVVSSRVCLPLYIRYELADVVRSARVMYDGTITTSYGGCSQLWHIPVGTTKCVQVGNVKIKYDVSFCLAPQNRELSSYVPVTPDHVTTRSGHETRKRAKVRATSKCEGRLTKTLGLRANQ